MILTRKLTRNFGNLVAVQQLDMLVAQGEIFGFLGPNGAGKTTTIRMLAGILRPSSGQLFIDGCDVQREPLSAKRRIGYLAQSPPLYDRLTGREFLRFVGALYGLDQTNVDGASERLLDITQLTDDADRLIESYSGGMRRKIGLCGALLHQPPLLILDEPLAGIDPLSAHRIKEYLKEVRDQGCTVFFSTHVLEVAERFCDRVGILRRGRLVAEGPLEALRQQARSGANSTLEDLFIQLTQPDHSARPSSLPVLEQVA